MNQADILKLAEIAGFDVNKKFVVVGYDQIDVTGEIIKFAELVAQHERETIAQIIKATRWLDADFGEHEGTKDMLIKCILAMGVAK